MNIPKNESQIIHNEGVMEKIFNSFIVMTVMILFSSFKFFTSLYYFGPISKTYLSLIPIFVYIILTVLFRFYPNFMTYVLGVFVLLNGIILLLPIIGYFVTKDLIVQRSLMAVLGVYFFIGSLYLFKFRQIENQYEDNLETT